MENRFELLYKKLKDIVDVGRFSPAMIKVMLDNLEFMSAWLESKTFKKRYAKLPYPPLINPKDLDYTQLHPSCAWDLNLPLPYVDIVFLRSHASGATGMNVFLQKCGGIQIYCENFYGLDARGVYMDVYLKILEARKKMQASSRGGGDKFIFLVVSDYAFEGDYKKYFALMPNVPAMNLVRDPILILTSLLNYKRQRDFREIFTLACNPFAILENRVGYGFYTDIKPMPSLESLPFWCFDKMMCFHDALMLKDCVQLRDVYYLDMQEIIGKNAHKAFIKLARYFGLEIPQDCDERFFERRIADFEFLLPLHIYAHSSDIEKLRYGFSNDLDALQLEGGVTVSIRTCYALENDEENVDITHLFFEEAIEPIIITIPLKDYERFLKEAQLRQVVGEYMQIFVKEVFAKRDREIAKRIAPKTLLEYFQTNAFMHQAFKEATERYLEVLRVKSPKIIESWVYYKEFLALKAV
ncbi:DUF2972 domain-containing protein [Helicobacter sp.]|uniref:DUF2972 domain-containing protein n=1 Tax=Helicobacter sp. TaxID=218 RepID=UPI0025C0B5FC|nr:DUF2972 domain-containing protein [Helicobacter sp.]MCI5968401.1 DUF2972 domain-containing protein [Helicobacter sp.]MDY2585186.1 DUF2972 domain-containing protein [Helicobacter sp.]